jgi:hypothetical protein
MRLGRHFSTVPIESLGLSEPFDAVRKVGAHELGGKPRFLMLDRPEYLLMLAAEDFQKTLKIGC